jgi:ribulose 1,5-bisphosphate synthetase/thiazole synthase
MRKLIKVIALSVAAMSFTVSASAHDDDKIKSVKKEIPKKAHAEKKAHKAEMKADKAEKAAHKAEKKVHKAEKPAHKAEMKMKMKMKMKTKTKKN